MFITTQHPRGAKKLSFKTLHPDTLTNKLGYKIGYCSCGCDESLLISISDIHDVLNEWGYINAQKEPKYIQKIKEKIILNLGGVLPQ